jgi:hypothetical protein
MDPQETEGTNIVPIRALPAIEPKKKFNIRLRRKELSPEEKLERKLKGIERENENQVKLDHKTGNMLVFAIATAAILGMAPDAIFAIAAQRFDTKDLIPLLVSFVVVIGANRALISAAGEIRYRKSRGEKADFQDRLILFSVMAIEAISFYYMLWIFAPTDSLVMHLLDGGRAIILPLVTVYLEQRVVHPIDPKAISVQSEIGLGLGVMFDFIRMAYDHSLPLALKIQNYRSTADLTPDMDKKLARQTRAAMAIEHYKRTGEILLLDDMATMLLGPNGKPLIAAQDEQEETQEEDIEPEDETEKKGVIKRLFGRKPKVKKPLKKKVSNAKPESRKDEIIAILVARLRAGETMSNPKIAKEFNISTSTASNYIDSAKAIVSATKKIAGPVTTDSSNLPPEPDHSNDDDSE